MTQLTESAGFGTEEDQKHGTCWGDCPGEEHALFNLAPQITKSKEHI